MVTTVLLSLLMFRVVLNFIVSFPGDNEYYVDHCTTFTADFWVVLNIMSTTVLLSLLMFWVILNIMVTTVLLSLLIISASFKYGD